VLMHTQRAWDGVSFSGLGRTKRWEYVYIPHHITFFWRILVVGVLYCKERRFWVGFEVAIAVCGIAWHGVDTHIDTACIE
jgi:hypothetical protein